MAIKVTSREAAAKFARNLGAATEDIRRGVERVTDNPCERAAARQEKMLANLTEAIRNGKWASGLRRVSLADWKKAFIEKGLTRIGPGANAAVDKLAKFYDDLFPHIEAGLRELDGMSDLTLEDNIARATAMMRHMHRFKRS